MQSIHGHDVIDMIQAAGHGFTRDGLITAIQSRFGTDTQFHTCSAEGMSASELVDFLIAKGKFLANSDDLRIDPSRVCQH